MFSTFGRNRFSRQIYDKTRESDLISLSAMKCQMHETTYMEEDHFPYSTFSLLSQAAIFFPHENLCNFNLYIHVDVSESNKLH